MAKGENEIINEKNRKAFREMSLGQKIGYLRDYYLLPAVLVVGGLLLVCFFLSHVLRPAEGAPLHVVIVDDILTDETREEVRNKMGEILGVPAEEIDITDSYSTSTTDGYVMLMAMLSANDVDIMILPEDMFRPFCADGGFTDLAELYPEGLPETFEDILVETAGPDTELTGEEHMYGLHFSEMEGYSAFSTSGTDAVCGIVGRSEHKDAAMAFAEYMAERYQS